MQFTQAQKFVYALLAMLFVTIVFLTFLNTYALDVFLVLIVIEFIIVAEITKPFTFNASWRKNMIFFIVILAVVLAVIFFKNAGDLFT